MKRSTARNITTAITGFVTGFALVLLVGLAWIDTADAATPPEGGHPPANYSEVTSVEGAWRVGWRTHNSDGTSWLLDPVPAVLKLQCGRGSDTARACQAEWRAFYRDMKTIRDANPAGPDYWPFPDETQ